VQGFEEVPERWGSNSWILKKKMMDSRIGFIQDRVVDWVELRITAKGDLIKINQNFDMVK